MIRIWQSYSCNNSSSFRLVARFAEPFQADETAVELRAFLAEHARQVDTSEGTEIFEGGNTEIANELATRYGFAWDSLLMWGGGGNELAGDEPSVGAAGGVLVVYHGYCSGFELGLQHYLAARGATSFDEAMGEPTLSVLFDFNGSAALARDLDLLIAQSGNTDNTHLQTPWQGEEVYGTTVFFHQAGTIGMYFPLVPSDLEKVRGWLADHDVIGASLVLCEAADEARFSAIAAARCTACEGPLKYMDPRIHDIEKPQLMCRPCGGFYDVETFLGTA